MADPIRWGVLATGDIARRFVIDLAQVADAQVVAVGSRTIEAAQEFAAAQGIARAYGSWRELADDPDIEIIYAATPHSHHHAAGLACLRAGKSVLMEKPFAMDLAESQELVTVARERGLFLMEAMRTRTNPATLRMLELIAQGAIGKVTSIHASFGLEPEFEPSHRLRNPALGGGALLDLGVYTVHFAQLFLGAPHQVRAWAQLHPEGTDARTGMVLGFPQGEVATLYCGVGGFVRMASIVGTKGRIEISEGLHSASRFTVHRTGVEPETVDCELAGLHNQAIEAGRCLRAGLTESPLVPLESTLAVMRTLDAVRAQIGVTY